MNFSTFTFIWYVISLALPRFSFSHFTFQQSDTIYPISIHTGTVFTFVSSWQIYFTQQAVRLLQYYYYVFICHYHFYSLFQVFPINHLNQDSHLIAIHPCPTFRETKIKTCRQELFTTEIGFDLSSFHNTGAVQSEHTHKLLNNDIFKNNYTRVNQTSKDLYH